MPDQNDGKEKWLATENKTHHAPEFIVSELRGVESILKFTTS